MTFNEILPSLMPTLILGVGCILLIRKSGLFGPRAHRERVEELLERIAQAVGKKKTDIQLLATSISG
jgi:Na+/H+ antiporter NhaB